MQVITKPFAMSILGARVREIERLSGTQVNRKAFAQSPGSRTASARLPGRQPLGIEQKKSPGANRGF
jgi:DNA-binding response OmpR family regulator